MRNHIKQAKRIVIKVGTSTLTHENGRVYLARLNKLTEVISDLMNQGKQVILVTSGAIGVGVGKMKLPERPHSIRERQAIAAIGQTELMQLYSKFFAEFGHVVGQILLTRDVVEEDQRRNHVINTFETLLEMEVLPIVNENDSVAVEELSGDKANFGDNDTLSAIVAELTHADLLIILSDIDGFYEADPHKNKDARIIHSVFEINSTIEEKAGGTGSNRGTGGMATKINAAKIAHNAGIDMIIAQGSHPEILYPILEGEIIGTLFWGRNHE